MDAGAKLTRGQSDDRTFSGRTGRVRWPRILLAAGLTAAQFGLLFLAWQGRYTAPPGSPAVTVIALPADLEEPVPPPPAEPNPPPARAQTAGGASPLAPQAPAARPFVPIPSIVLTEFTEPASPAPLDLPLGLVGANGTSGNGRGSGGGEGDGTGSGQGGGSARAPARTLTTTWAPGMRFDRLQQFYPDGARLERIAGVARLDCEVRRRDRVRDCRLLGEVPRDHGFGEAALAAQHVYRVRVHDQNDDRVYGERIVLNAHFRPRD